MSFNDFLYSLEPEKVYGFGGLFGCLLFSILTYLISIRVIFKRLFNLEHFIYDKLFIDEERK